jgi:cell division protein FtsB
MKDSEIETSFDELRKRSRVSLSLVLLGALLLVGSIYYSATRLKPLEEEVAQKQYAVDSLAKEESRRRASIDSLKNVYKTLRTSAENLYSVRVTPDNQVYELKATAQATGKMTSKGPEYRFTIFINSSAQTLESIERVTYHFAHETFKQKDYIAKDMSDRFAMSYRGWGCLTKVTATVALKDGTSHVFDFDMCRSLGPEWG